MVDFSKKAPGRCFGCQWYDLGVYIPNVHVQRCHNCKSIVVFFEHNRVIFSKLSEVVDKIREHVQAKDEQEIGDENIIQYME